MADQLNSAEAPELARRANLLLPGLYAWAATVFYPASFHGAGWLPRVTAALALVALSLAAAFGSRGDGALRRVLGLYGFVALSVLTWLALGRLIAVDHLEPIKAALGAVGWALFAFGWGVVREPARVPEDDPRVLAGDLLRPKGQLSRAAATILTASVVGAALPVCLAWRVTRPYHALFAHSISVLLAIWLVSSGSEIAVGVGHWAPVTPPARRLGQALVPLLLLGLLLIVGVVELFSL
ncbi:MAG TPA: hypothetical protein VH142_07700 [Polyangiaceae bacterium]|nr:hypothetical protein [Polyangiaceae bacterium]